MHQQAGAGLAGVFLAKRAQAVGVTQAGLRGGLDLDGQQEAVRLDDEIHLLAGRRASKEHLGAVRARIAPGEQIAEHQILQMRAIGFGHAGDVQRQAGVAN